MSVCKFYGTGFTKALQSIIQYQDGIRQKISCHKSVINERCILCLRHLRGVLNNTTIHCCSLCASIII